MIIKNKLPRMFAIFAIVGVLSGLFLESTRLFARAEQQSINLRFQLRPWLLWHKESLARLNPYTLWHYHENHEIPRKWWAWDYTLSWLIENNHPAVKTKVVIFNHSIEDEPPKEAADAFSWMKPLLIHPLSRATMADIIDFLARGGARVIVLDNDFPQYTEHDARLARAIHEAASGKTSGVAVPVIVARTINRKSSSSLLQLETPTAPAGLFEELQKLEPGSDVATKYSGTTGFIMDEDQVVRRAILRMPSFAGSVNESIVLKVLQAGKLLPVDRLRDLPDVIDVDFAAQPKSDLYPVRPMSYLLDPQKRREMLKPPRGYEDVQPHDAVVIIGDEVIDSYSTPVTNFGVNLMSGSEILAHAIDTASRGSFPVRVQSYGAILYLLLVTLLSAFVTVKWKFWQQQRLQCNQARSSKNIVSPDSPPGNTQALQAQPGNALVQLQPGILVADTIFLAVLLSLQLLLAGILFVFTRLLVPVVVPAVATTLAYIAALVFEREAARVDALKRELDDAQQMLELERRRHQTELELQAVEAREREMVRDKEQRREFARRINHDLKAPVSVLNWTLSKLKADGLEKNGAKEKLDRLSKTSDRLAALINELVQSYDAERSAQEVAQKETCCDIVQTVKDAAAMQKSLAEARKSQLSTDACDESVVAKVEPLQISRVIDNLIRNALLHNAEGTTVKVSVSAEDRLCRIAVVDDGRGIAEDSLQHIFESGYRVESNNPGPLEKSAQGRSADEKSVDGPSGRGQDADGQGLGLSIVKTLVEGAGGSISVKSVVNQGTTFMVTLPRVVRNDGDDNHIAKEPATVSGMEESPNNGLGNRESSNISNDPMNRRDEARAEKEID